MNNNNKISYKYINVINEIVHLTMCVLFIFLIYEYLGEIFIKENVNRVGGILTILIIVIGDYFMRKGISNVFMFLGAHLLLFVPGFVLTNSVFEWIILVGAAGSYLLMGISFWKNDGSENKLSVIDIPLGLIIFFIVVFIHSSYSMSAFLSNYAYIAGVAYVILHFIRLYLGKFISYSISTGGINPQLKNTFKINFSMILMFSVIILIIVGVINEIAGASGSGIIGRFIKYLASLIVGFLSRFKDNSAHTEAPTKEMEVVTGKGGQSTPLPHEANNTGNVIGNTLFTVLQVVIFTGIALAVIYVIYMFFKNYMNRNKETNDIIKKAEPVTKKDKSQGTFKNIKNSIFKSNRDKIRKIYSETVKGYMKNNNRLKIKPSSTTGEISKEIVNSDNIKETSVNTLTKIYEKARYSNMEITKEDVERAKKSI